MRYFIVDDDPAVRGTLTNLLENDLFADVVGEAEDGADVHAYLLNSHQVDILLIDFLMPQRDGIETLSAIYPEFKGKAVMLSQIEAKDIIASAYQNNAEAYITKPMNRREVLAVLQRVERSLKLESSMRQIQQSLQLCNDTSSKQAIDTQTPTSDQILTDLGILYEKGSEDLSCIVKILRNHHDGTIPPLKELWKLVAMKNETNKHACPKEMKAIEQRVRRAIQHSFNHISSLGAMDLTHPKFEYYGMTFFDLDQLQSKINVIHHGDDEQDKASSTRLNIKKFIYALYDECTPGKREAGGRF